MNFIEFLQQAIKSGASDIHLATGVRPALRINKALKFIQMPGLTQKDIVKILDVMLSDSMKKKLEDDMNIDFTYEDKDKNRYRVNIFYFLGGTGIAMRVIAREVKTLETLRVPAIIETFTKLESGLVLVTGPTNSGKSTTLAAMVEQINMHENRCIVTIEDPIEYRFENKKSLISQREIGETAKNFHSALRSALREDPDVIMIGELRDTESMQLALTAAETGHLVFATLHTTSAISTINRIIDMFPSTEKSLVVSLLSMVLQAVVSQRLLPRLDGKGMVGAYEVMVATPAVRNLIREQKVHQIKSAMQVASQRGMIQMQDSLAALVRDGLVDRSTISAIGAEAAYKESDFSGTKGSDAKGGDAKSIQHETYKDDDF